MCRSISRVSGAPTLRGSGIGRPAGGCIMPLTEVMLVNPGGEHMSKFGRFGRSNPLATALSNQPMGTKLRALGQGTTLGELGFATIGVVAGLAVPKLVKYDTGWQDVIVAGVTTVVGGWIISRWSMSGAKAFVIGAGSITVLKALRLLAAQGKEAGILGQDKDELFGQDEELFGQDELFGIGATPKNESIYGADFGEGEDVIRPTASIEEFVE